MKTFYDIHCHIFNKDVIIRRLVSIVQSLLNIKDLLENQISEEDLKYKMELINNTLSDISNGTSEDVFKALNSVYEGKIVITPLMFDLTYADDNDGDEEKNKRYRKRIKKVLWLLTAVVLPIIRMKLRRKFKNQKLILQIDEIRKKIKELNKNFDKKTDEEVELFDNANYEQQVEDLEYLSKKHTTIKPFFNVDPRREYKDGVNMLEKVKEKILSENSNFYGVKLYTPAGFSPTDPVLMGTESQSGIYALCEQNGIPITVHNSNSGFACLSSVLLVRGHVYLNHAVIETDKRITFENQFFSLKASEAIAEKARILNHPKLWAVVLEQFPKLKINFAHFGGSGQIMEYINYTISKNIMDVDAFENHLLPLSASDKEIILSVYKKQKNKMVLKKNLTIFERGKAWNAMYRSGLIDNWAKAIFDLIKNPDYPNAYTDLSCFSEGMLISDPQTGELVFSIKEPLNTFKNSFFDKLSDYEKSKFLYGSDFFLAQFFGPTLKQYLTDFKASFGPDFELISSHNPHRFLFEKEKPEISGKVDQNDYSLQT